ncbi:uncharacterized protein J7T54_002699 [Emericellopsis cladophorae]|uniref:Uncharacterized protein n=1 Tax=Emericellopsis cladophorae TaxID=2686198 RepID=A0A9P9XUR9_9HYPO|nr:uncharacterized protein J7T54_002699 [Emericellopsis cladophorae]KAI6778164.1 hypothetical protein J7T54_002699 [Emericellopsis cladophorae]
MHLPSIAALCLTCASMASAVCVTQEMVETIAPKSKECPPSMLPECRTAAEAAPYITRAFHRYGIYNPNAMASVMALMALESGEFQYKRNAFPGRPGQGTANMQMAEFNLKYAKSIGRLEPRVANVTTVDRQSDTELNRILDLVVADDYNFGSGAWFLRSECGEKVLSALNEDVDAGFAAHMDCVGVEADNEERQAYLTLAKQAFDL